MSELTKGEFKETSDDDTVTDATKVERLILCSGKIFYELMEEKEQGAYDNVAIVRIEQFIPHPKSKILLFTKIWAL